MEKINRHNYEAYFLDFSEGNLSSRQIAELEEFLDENPELRAELDEFEIFELPDAVANAEAWSDLKKPSLRELHENAEVRDTFFLRAVENDLSSFELKMLEELIADNAYASEYDLWKRIFLIADESKIQKDSLYQFGLDQSVTEFNYDYFLIARCEGLLSSKQNTDLEKFAEARPNGARELAIADNLKLKPAQGIFYPNKSELYQKEKRGIVIWLYRAASIAAAILLGVFIWNQVGTNSIETAPVANIESNQVQGSETPGDTNKLDNAVKRDSFPEVEVIEEPLLEDWQVREPDPVEYAEENKEKPKRIVPEDVNGIDYNEIESIEKVGTDNFALNKENPDLEEDSLSANPNPDIDENLDSETLAEAKPASKFKTVPELAEDLMAQKLNIPDSEKDEIALVLAKRITSRASELLDAEYTKKETGTEGEESLTYTLRIGSFKVKRTKTK